MKSISTLFLRLVIVLIGMGTLIFMFLEPHFEGRNIHATTTEIYFKDPFLAYVYIGSVAFFVALYQIFKLLGYLDRDEFFSQHSLQALKNIQYCATTLIVFILGAEAYLLLFIRDKDDIAGGVAIGLFLICAFATVAATTTAFKRTVQNSIHMKSNI